MDEILLDRYPRLDLSPLLAEGKFAVHCQTEYEAECLLAEMKRSYPDKCGQWSLPNVHWEDTEDEGQLYFPDINNAERTRYCWSSMSYDEKDDYTIIECCMLFATPPAEIEESNIPIDFLVGGGV